MTKAKDVLEANETKEQKTAREAKEEKKYEEEREAKQQEKLKKRKDYTSYYETNKLSPELRNFGNFESYSQHVKAENARHIENRKLQQKAKEAKNASWF